MFFSIKYNMLIVYNCYIENNCKDIENTSIKYYNGCLRSARLIIYFNTQVIIVASEDHAIKRATALGPTHPVPEGPNGPLEQQTEEASVPAGSNQVSTRTVLLRFVAELQATHSATKEEPPAANTCLGV